MAKQHQYYWAGQNAYHDGKKEEDCPHRSGIELSEWLRGYHDAQDDVENPDNE